MSNFIFPASGGLKITVNGVQYGIWIQDMGPPGIDMIAARYDATAGWIAFWNHGLGDASDYQAEINVSGGIIAWIKTLLAKINAAFAKLLGSAPAPTSNSTFTIDNVNQALATSFTLTAGANGVPVIAAK